MKNLYKSDLKKKKIFLNYHFELFGVNCMAIITTGQILFIFWITNYQGFWNNHINSYLRK
jgi:hypothetical protein